MGLANRGPHLSKLRPCPCPRENTARTSSGSLIISRSGKCNHVLLGVRDISESHNDLWVPSAARDAFTCRCKQCVDRVYFTHVTGWVSGDEGTQLCQRKCLWLKLGLCRSMRLRGRFWLESFVHGFLFSRGVRRRDVRARGATGQRAEH